VLDSERVIRYAGRIDDHYAIAARAGGLALERILKTRPKTNT